MIRIVLYSLPKLGYLSSKNSWRAARGLARGLLAIMLSNAKVRHHRDAKTVTALDSLRIKSCFIRQDSLYIHSFSFPFEQDLYLCMHTSQ